MCMPVCVCFVQKLKNKCVWFIHFQKKQYKFLATVQLKALFKGSNLIGFKIQSTVIPMFTFIVSCIKYKC